MRYIKICHLCGQPIQNAELGVQCNRKLWAHDSCIRETYGLKMTGVTYDIKAIQKKITRRK